MGDVYGKYRGKGAIKALTLCTRASRYRDRAVHRKCRAAISGTPALKPAIKLLVGLLARLVGNAAAGLASALAGSLAFAAAAVQQALSHVAGLESLDVLHKTVTPLYILELYLLYTGLAGLSSHSTAIFEPSLHTLWCNLVPAASNAWQAAKNSGVMVSPGATSGTPGG